jgi:hypothetical protein
VDRHSYRSLAAPLGVGAAMAGAAVYVISRPPMSGSWYPPCAFHAATGLWCPGCGMTRGIHALLTGDVAAAMSFNLFSPVVFVAAIVGWLTWLQASRGRAMPWSGRRPGAWLYVVMPVVLVAYGVLRNIPAEPFAALSP